MKTKASTIPNDIPMKIIKEFGVELSFPLADIINRGISFGEYPDIFKTEIVTPVPKEKPTPSPNELRKISGLKNLSKIIETILSEFIIEDMKEKSDPSQYGNTKGISINHYLIKMIHKIYTSVDKNSTKEAYACLAELIDWNQAFDRQCPKLGVQSFIDNGVRPELIPILISYFENRKMIVKWHDKFSSERPLLGGGPQGATLGIIEYTSQCNNNCDFVAEDERYKFVDDMSIIEVINLITTGISSYNFKHHIASDVGIDQKFIPKENLKSQQYLENIEKWTADKKMKLNQNKTKYMIFNFTNNYQFATRLHMNETLLECVNEVKLLGVIITSDLSWSTNTSFLVKKAYARMQILRKLYSFNVSLKDLILIYVIFIRCYLEQSCVVWSSSINQEDSRSIERVQKVALRICLKDGYDNYESALLKVNLETLENRRKDLCTNFAKSCVKNDATKLMFPLNDNTNSQTRNPEKYHVQYARTARLANSAIPYMQRLLNSQS